MIELNHKTCIYFKDNTRQDALTNINMKDIRRSSNPYVPHKYTI